MSSLSPATRPVIVRFAAMGDAVLLTVLIRRLAERYGSPVNLLSSGGWTRALLKPDPAVGDIELVTSRKRPYWLTPSQQAAVTWLKTQRGPIYLCDPDKYSLQLVQRAVEKERIIRVWDHWPRLDTHWADWWESVGTGQPLRANSGQPRLTIAPDAHRDAERWMREKGLAQGEFLLVQPGNKKTSKRFTWNRENDKFWPLERWTQTIRAALAARPSLKVVVCGSPPEAALAEGIAMSCNDARVFSGATDLPIPRFAALASMAHSMITIDTGPAHVAAAVNCPSVVLFGAFGSNRWAPRAPSARVVCLGGLEETKDGHVNRISTDEVIAAWKTLRND